MHRTFRPFLVIALLTALPFTACQRAPDTAAAPAPPTDSVASSHPATAPASPLTPALSLVAAARSQIGVTTSYDPTYRVIAYPNGDVPLSTGVCTDVVIRALRQQSIDLQSLVHQDMAAHFSDYPRKWNLPRPDRNIDHRRVPNLMTYLTRQNHALPITRTPADYHPGDLVTWDLSGRGLTHIGIVSDRTTPAGTPLVIHNMGQGTREEDILFRFTQLGHYRLW